MDPKKLHKREYNAEWRKANREYYNLYMKEYMAYRREKKELEKMERAREWLRSRQPDKGSG